ncbi:MAG: ABC transporter substrate-binding protein [Brevinema sp.]
MKVLWILIFLGACTTQNIKKDTLNVAVPIEATGLYPYMANDPHSSRVSVLLFDTLIKRDTNGVIIPSLAESWEYQSSTVIDFKIRTNIFFHNGDILTLDDVQFSFEEILSIPNLAHTVGVIEHTEITPDQKFRVILKEPYAPFIPLMGYLTFKIVNKAYVESNRQDIAQKPMGTGPYRLKKWNRGQNIILEKHDGYWEQEAYIQEINIRTVNDPVSRALALETGDVDIAYEIEGSDQERIEENPNLVLMKREIPRVEYIAMNIGKGKNILWKDKRGRQAFSYAIDRDGIVNSVLFGMGQAADSLLPPLVTGYQAQNQMRDIEKAKQLLEEMEIYNPSMTIWVREGVSQKVGEVVQANLREIGIDTKLEVVEYARFLEGIARGEHDVFLLNWTTITADADYGLNNLLNSESWGSKGNRSFYSNEEVDSLLAQGRYSFNEEDRNRIYYRIQNIIADDVPYIPIYYTELGVGMKKEVQGFEFDIFSDYQLSKVYFDQLIN